METFGRGCLYLVIGFIFVFVFAWITRSTINIPWFILIPLVILAFWIAGKKGK
ncbi:hypothetical protein PN4B1_13600 [Paenibacillus naphthalenovorans]|uniref:hypothetical protein n=1 Tax=Paenibacillus naphthalenovorans TaxID=162209 RepID=UPI0010B51613|nr:hypothetical protein [Paenibacillus naphthalenovorans]GCL71455.1 hypothetical protein PN4B1_13600 [Paenibacillus naphthalenovorans]